MTTAIAFAAVTAPFALLGWLERFMPAEWLGYREAGDE